jgi:hypothetical protein
LNAEGDDWECAAAFKRVVGVCVAMTAEEVAERARQYEESARNAFTRVGPETGLCQIGYNKCTSACSGGVLAPAAGKKVKSAAFTSACMMACDSGRQACASSSGVCDAFDSACSTDCPEEAFDSDNGAALSAADGHGVCARACQLGGRWCQDQRRKMPTAKGNP